MTVPVMLDGRVTTSSWNYGRFWKMTPGGLRGQPQRCCPPSSIPTGTLFKRMPLFRIPLNNVSGEKNKKRTTVIESSF